MELKAVQVRMIVVFWIKQFSAFFRYCSCCFCEFSRCCDDADDFFKNIFYQNVVVVWKKIVHKCLFVCDLLIQKRLNIIQRKKSHEIEKENELLTLWTKIILWIIANFFSDLLNEDNLIKKHQFSFFTCEFGIIRSHCVWLQWHAVYGLATVIQAVMYTLTICRMD